jgi:DNA-directed RNA polymerase beta' subunit
MELYYDDKNTTDASKQQIILTADEARKILVKISDATCRLIGLNPDTSRPENMILTVFPVPPMCIRPSVRMDFSSQGEDDLTQILLNIVRYNNELKKYINQRGSTGIEYNKELLQQHVTCYLDGETGGQPKNFQKGSKPLKSVVTRLKGKGRKIKFGSKVC